MVGALIEALGYIAPLLAFVAIAVALIALLWMPDEAHEDARRRNHAHRIR